MDLYLVKKKIFDYKRLYFITCGLAFVIGSVLMFGTPNYYRSEVVLVPEVGGGGSLSDNLSDLASMVGVNLDSKSSIDALYPELYPQIISSTPFLSEIYEVKVSTLDGRCKGVRYCDYLVEYERKSLWAWVKNAIGKMFKSADTLAPLEGNIMTKEQESILKNINDNITCSVDRKTSVITLSVVDKDPLVAANIADIIQEKLQDYIIDYRTKKSTNDVVYYESLFKTAKREYEEATAAYASFADSNFDIILTSTKSKQDHLENDMQLKYNTYTQVAQQLQMAKSKLQERIPAFSQLQPAMVPNKKAGPKRTITIAIMVIIAFCVTSLYTCRELLFVEKVNQ